jgi:hypothetical protein
LTNCTFISNAGERGAGIYNGGSSPALTNCAFIANWAEWSSGIGYGGAMCSDGSCTPTLTNCTITANMAPNGPGLAFLGQDVAGTVVNCVIWNGANWLWNDDGSAISITHSDVQGGSAGQGNIDGDPRFVCDPDPGPDGAWETDDDEYGDLRLAAGSPCIDAGNNDAPGLASIATDLGGNLRFVDDPRTPDTGLGMPPLVDMGAYEFIPSSLPALMATDPPMDGTLPKTKNNVILLVFDGPIAWSWGPLLCIVDLQDGTDVTNSFGYIDVDDRTLRVRQIPRVVLPNQRWYRIRPRIYFNVQPFTLDVCTLEGDADGSGRVTAADYFPVKNHLSEMTDARYDLNGDGQVTALDYFVVKNHAFDATPPKP